MKKAFLCLITILTIVFIPNVYAEEGSKTQPYEVSTVEQLSAALETGGYIKLTASIDAGDFTGDKFVIKKGMSVTIDLNGYTLSGKNNDETKASALIHNVGTLVINDSGNNGKITMSDTNVALGTWAVAMLTIKNQGSLVVNGGTIENTGGCDVPYAIDNNSTSYDVYLEINGGTISAPKLAIRAFANSTTKENDIVVNGGTIKGKNGIWLHQSNSNPQKASLEINGGTISATTGHAVYASVWNSSNDGAVSMTINGGTLTNNSETVATVSYEDFNGGSLNNSVLNLTVTGGEITNQNENGNALMDPYITDANTSSFEITGGTFSQDISEYKESGYSSIQQSDGSFLIAKISKISSKESKNGTVSVQEEGIEGEKVKVTVKANEGYEFDKITVKTASGANVKVSGKTFTMPSEDVTVTAVFEKIENPDTTDSIVVYMITLFISASVLGIYTLKTKKLM